MKRKTKKILLIVLAIIAAVAVIAVSTVLIVKYVKRNVGTTIISFENQTAIAGDTVKLPVNIIKNHGIWGGQIKINYDTNALEFVSCANGEVFDECQANGDSGSVIIIVNQSDISEVKSNGTVATLNFNIRESASKTNYAIRFDSISNFSDSEGELIEIELKNGTVTVK